MRLYMGFAELTGRYPAGPQLREIIERRRQLRTDLQKMPSVIVLADIFRQEGSYGFRELIGQVERAGVAIGPDEKFFQQIPDQYKSPIYNQYAAIVFGISIRSLHEMLLEGSFDGEVWCAMHNLSIAGTCFPSLNPKEKTSDRVPAGNLVILWQSALQDKTLSFFFETPGLMPNMLRKVLEDLGVLPVIFSTILPLYRERAQFLLSPQV